jgi:hypothetical protein
MKHILGTSLFILSSIDPNAYLMVIPDSLIAINKIHKMARLFQRSTGLLEKSILK